MRSERKLERSADTKESAVIGWPLCEMPQRSSMSFIGVACAQTAKKWPLAVKEGDSLPVAALRQSVWKPDIPVKGVYTMLLGTEEKRRAEVFGDSASAAEILPESHGNLIFG